MTHLPDLGEGSPAKRETRRFALVAAGALVAFILAVVIWAILV
ncbi:MAG TPA: hypothetical protein VG144_04380 [Gaiellaceae bacterium]|jgi:hypothetical protein|nr:hypothetical protein [Gaiellaceae bacterium]